MLFKYILPRSFCKSVVIVILMAMSVAAKSQESELLDFLPAIIAGARPLPKPINFSVRLPQMSSPIEYRVDINTWDIPVNFSNAVKTTDNLQAAINWASAEGYNRIVIPDGNYLIGKFGNSIYQRGIELPASMELVLSANTVLKMVPNDKWNYCLIAVTGKTDVTIRGGTLLGDRDQHVYTPRASDGKTAHDEGHGICLQSGTQRVLVTDMTIHNMTGDGLLLVTDIKDVTIRGNNIHSNRRQGVSVVGGIRIAIEHNEIHHIRGTAPQFGVDIEGAGRKDKDIVIRGNSFHHNRGGDVVNTSGENVFIINNVMHQGSRGQRYIDGPIVSWHRTDQVISRNRITMLDRSVNGFLGYIQYSSGGAKGHKRVTYVHDNVCNGCGMYMYKSADADIRRNKWHGYFLALADFRNAVVIDNQTSTSPEPGSPRYCWSYRIRNTTGLASGNKHNGNGVNLPLSSNPWTTLCLR